MIRSSPSLPYSAIVFDFGGVLLEWDPRNLYRRYFSDDQMMEDFLEEIRFNEWNAQQDRGRPFAEGIADLSSRFPHHARMIQLFYQEWIHTIRGPIDETIAILYQVKQAGWPVFGLSNWSCETFPLVREKYSFFNILDSYLLSCEVKLVKPDPAIYRAFLRKIDREADECIYIDDSIVNITSASKLGFKAIHYKDSKQLERELEEINVL